MAGASRDLSQAEVAERAGVSQELVARLLELGILKQRVDGTFDPYEFRKIGVATAIEDAGMSLEAVAEGMRRGLVGLVAQQEYSRFLGLTPGVAFDDIGSVQLKGVTGTVQLAAAHRSTAGA
jgi:predicted transcriptional regulator